jgi:hypothetical protein
VTLDVALVDYEQTVYTSIEYNVVVVDFIATFEFSDAALSTIEHDIDTAGQVSYTIGAVYSGNSVPIFANYPVLACEDSSGTAISQADLGVTGRVVSADDLTLILKTTAADHIGLRAQTFSCSVSYDSNNADHNSAFVPFEFSISYTADPCYDAVLSYGGNTLDSSVMIYPTAIEVTNELGATIESLQVMRTTDAAEADLTSCGA